MLLRITTQSCAALTLFALGCEPSVPEYESPVSLFGIAHTAHTAQTHDDARASGRRREPLARGRVGVAAADYLIERWPELDATAQDCTGPDDCFSMNFATVPASPAPKFWEYTYGVPLYALQKLYAKTGDTRYEAYVRKYVDRYVNAEGVINYGRSWPVAADGMPPAANDPTIQDVIQPSTLLFELYASTQESKYLKALASTRAIFPQIAQNAAGALRHKPSYPNQQSLDGIYMSEPFLVRYGALYADASDATRCFDTAVTQIELVAKHTFNPATRLYYHAWNGAPDGVWQGLQPPTKVAPLTGTEVSPILWGRSIGWLLAGVVDVLEFLPPDHPGRTGLREIVANIAHGLEQFQEPATGLFYQVVDVMDSPLPAQGGYPDEYDRPAQRNWLETSASALFAYGLAKAVRLGDLHPRYQAVARRAWRGVRDRIDLAADGGVTIHGTVVGMSVGGTYNAYVNADFNVDLFSGPPAAPDTCLTADQLPAGKSPTIDCKYSYVRDNVPQGFGAVILAASELEY